MTRVSIHLRVCAKTQRLIADEAARTGATAGHVVDHAIQATYGRQRDSARPTLAEQVKAQAKAKHAGCKVGSRINAWALLLIALGLAGCGAAPHWSDDVKYDNQEHRVTEAEACNGR